MAGPENQSKPSDEGAKKAEEKQPVQRDEREDKKMPTKGEQSMKAWLVDKSLGTAANQSKLLPRGTTLAFQTMALAFTKGEECEDHDVNFWFTWGFAGFLAMLCAALSFTDSVTDRDGKTYYGYVTRTGLKLFNHKLEELNLFEEEGKDKENRLAKLEQEKKVRPRDYLHAILRTFILLALAFCDANVQRCLVPTESEHWQDFLANLPLAMGFLAGFLFMIFPSTRNGIGDDGPAAPPEMDTKTATTAAGDSVQRPPSPPHKTGQCNSSVMTMDTTLVATPVSCEIDRVV